MQDKSKNILHLINGKTFEKGTLTSYDVLAVVAEKIGEENIRQLVSYTALVQDKLPSGKVCHEVKFLASPESDRLLNEIAQDTIERYNLKDARLFHAIGCMKIDDDQILAVAVGEDRKETFKAIHEMILAAKLHAGIQGTYVLSDGTEIDVSP